MTFGQINLNLIDTHYVIIELRKYCRECKLDKSVACDDCKIKKLIKYVQDPMSRSLFEVPKKRYDELGNRVG